MTPLPKPTRAARAAIAAALAALALAALAAPALARGGPQFHRGGLPAIGEITLAKTPRGLARITVPVTYTKALSGPPRGLESSRVTLHVAAGLRHGDPVGTAVERALTRVLHGSGSVDYRFTLGPRKSRRLLGERRGLRGRLVRVDVAHLIRERRGARPLHTKFASSTLAASHRARPAGASGNLDLSNDTGETINTIATPIVCMYTHGEEGVNLEDFSGELLPEGSFEAEIEASASVFDDAEWEGPRGASPGLGFDALGVAADVIGDAFDVELGPFVGLLDLASSCRASVSIFSLVAANASGTAAASGAWVPTEESCSHGCPQSELISTYEALGYQYRSHLWASESTGLLEKFDGFYYPEEAEDPGRMDQDNGLHFEAEEYAEEQFEIRVGQGSQPPWASG